MVVSDIMDDKKMIDMVEKFTQSSTTTALNIKTITEVLDKTITLISSVKTKQSLMVEACKRIENDLEKIRDSIVNLSKDVAVTDQKMMSNLNTIKTEERDVKKIVTKILVEVVKIATIASLVVAFIKGGRIL